MYATRTNVEVWGKTGDLRSTNEVHSRFDPLRAEPASVEGSNGANGTACSSSAGYTVSKNLVCFIAARSYARRYPWCYGKGG